MEGRAIPLIIQENKKFRLTDESIELLNSIEGKVGVVAVVGKYRTGKSFLLNRIILKTEGEQGFGVGPSINPCTKGLWIWSNPIKVKNADGEEVSVLIVDSEGLGAFDEDANHDTRIFLLALLLSSMFVYNSVGSIDECALQNLSLIVNLSKQLQVKSSQASDPEEIAQYFPSFLWVLRDFALRLVDSQGSPINSRQYLENALMPQKGVSDAVEAKNRIRRLLSGFFKERDCFTLVRPTESEKTLQKLDQASPDQFRPEFLEQASKLQRLIFRKVKPKTINGKFFTGHMLAELAQAYTEAINTGGVPNIEGAWTSVCQAECQKALEESLKYFETQLKALSIPLPEEELESKLQELSESATKILKEKGFSEGLEGYLEKLKTKVSQKLSEFREKNQRASEAELKKELTQWWKGVSDQLKKGNLTSFEALKEEFKKTETNLKERTNTTRSEAKVYEYLLRSYTQAAEYVASNSQTELQNEIRRLQMQVSYLQDLNQRQKEDWSQEKELLQKRLNEQEKELYSLRASQATHSSRLEDIQKEKQRLEESYKERIEYLKETLSEKYGDIKDKYQEAVKELNSLKSTQSQELSEVKKENALHSQEIEFRKREAEDLRKRKEELETEVKELRSAVNKYQEELESKDNLSDRKQRPSTESSEEWQSERAFLKSQIESLRANIEDNKSVQEALMAALQSKKTESSSSADKAFETNKHLSYALDKMEDRCKYLEQKVKRLKHYQVIVKASQSIKCKNCFKNVSSASFSSHLSNCHGQENSEPPESDLLKIQITHTVVKDNEERPYTEYQLFVSDGETTWQIARRYKMFCNLHSSLQQMFPHIQLPDASALFSFGLGKRPMVLEERKKLFQNYLGALARIPVVRESSVFRDFIGAEDVQPSPKVNKRGKSVNDVMATSRMFSPFKHSPQLSPITNKHDYY